jgi:hypothetical protein
MQNAMSEITLSEFPVAGRSADAAAAQAAQAHCEECLGSGGWYRYEPALDPAPGLLYLACMQCRGSGRLADPARA